MNNMTRTLIPILLLGPSFSAWADRSAPVEVAIAPFETSGETDPAFAHSAHQKLSSAVRNDRRFQVLSDGDAAYLVTGHVHTDTMRHFVALKLLDAGTGETLWFENFDYIGITPEMMAEDLILALAKVSQSGVRE